jgi:hypothetical protein
MPPIDVKNEIIIATSGGRRTDVLTPDTGNSTSKKSMGYYTQRFQGAKESRVQVKDENPYYCSESSNPRILEPSDPASSLPFTKIPRWIII